MSPINDAEKVAVVGSPSTNTDIAIDLLNDASHEPLVGQMLFVTHPIKRGEESVTEVGLGVVTEITQTNQFHSNPNLRSVIKQHGGMKNLTGDAADTRTAHINLQASYIENSDSLGWRQSGVGLSTAPPTGALARKVSDEVLTELIAATAQDVHYLGYLHGSATRGSKIRAPFAIPDFNGPEGAAHFGFFGLSGSGKALALDTPIPTPNGWVTMGELRDGDVIFDESGNVCTVVKAHEVLLDRPCYKVEFSDGSQIIADAEHLWYSETVRDRAASARYRALDVSAKRAPLLSPEIIARLRAKARALSPESVITVREVVELTGLSSGSSAIKTACRSVGPAGHINLEQDFVYPDQVVSSTRMLPSWPRREILLALAGLCSPENRVMDENMASVLSAAAGEQPDSQITLDEISKLMGDRTRKNSHLRRMVAKTGIASTTIAAQVSSHVKSKTVTRRISQEVTVYPARDLLTVLADHCELPRGDQRHKRGNIGGVYTTKEMLDSLVVNRDQANHAIPVAGAIQTPDADLLIDPYVLGIWLGDGDKDSSDFTTADSEVCMFVEGAGYKVVPLGDIHYGIRIASEAVPSERLCAYCSSPFAPKAKHQYFCQQKHAIRALTEGITVPTPVCEVCQENLPKGARGRSHKDCQPMLTVTGQLDLLGVRNNKHIPIEYLRASEAQRRALLAGLLDSDGYATRNGGINFDNTNKALIDGVYELAISLGYRATISEKQATLNGVDCGRVWRVAFTTSDEVFRLTRKAIMHKERSTNHNPAKVSHRYVKNITPVDSVPVRCITVDSPNRLYLAGEAMIPTHNTAITDYVLASTMRFRDQGLIIIDPQGQWAAETELPFSLQGWATELGRSVMVKRISEDLRLSKDAPLFTALLGKTKFLQELGRMAPENQLLLLDEIEKIIRDRDDWDTEDSATLLKHILSTVTAETGTGENPFTYLGRVYADPKRCERLRDQIHEVLDSTKRMSEVLRYFSVIHNLFQPKNPAGGDRESLREVVSRVINRNHDAPAPMLVLDMSTSDISWLDTALADDEQLEILDALSILDQDNIKAAILRQIGTALKVISEAAFRRGDALNTIVMLDEAWRYVPPAGPDTEPEIKALSKDFAGYARDWRKFGLGLWFISQTTRSINPDIWDQLSVRFIGYGLAGPDMERIADHLDSRESLRLYKAFAPPKSTNPRIYPWLVMGPVSPLSFTKAPIAIAAYTDFDEFRKDNEAWISDLRKELGMPVLTGVPARLSSGDLQAAAEKLVKSSRSKAAAAGLTKKSKAQLSSVQANRETGGVEMGTYTSHSTDDSFGMVDFDLDDEPTGANGRPIDNSTGEEFPF